MKQKISLKNWIDQEGVHKIAHILKVEESTVRHWRRGHCLPRTEQMRTIRKLSKGLVTYETIIDTYFDLKRHS